MPVQFSVIIPCYNAAQWIEATIQSVLNQTVPQSEVEIIVVDDGSKDDSISRIKSIQVANLRLISISNHGVSYARNIGTAASSGQFIQYLDADDLLLPDALILRKQALLDHAADVAYGRYERLMEQGDGIFKTDSVAGKKMEEISPDAELAAFSSFWVPPVALMYRRNVVEKVGAWNRTLPVIQDARFIQDAAHHNAKFIYVPEILGVYRVHRKGSLSKRNLYQFEWDILKNARQTENRWRKNGLLTPARISYLAFSYRRSAEKFFENNPVRFRLALVAHRRLRKMWEIGFVDFFAIMQAGLGVESVRIITKPVWFCVRGFRFLSASFREK